MSRKVSQSIDYNTWSLDKFDKFIAINNKNAKLQGRGAQHAMQRVDDLKLEKKEQVRLGATADKSITDIKKDKQTKQLKIIATKAHREAQKDMKPLVKKAEREKAEREKAGWVGGKSKRRGRRHRRRTKKSKSSKSRKSRRRTRRFT